MSSDDGSVVPSGERDRDAAGRPRNARPRDALGRPLPHGVPGVETIPDDLTLPPDDSLAQAQRLLDTDRPFQAHEVLEAAWKTAPDGERELWQGLAQLAVGVTHARRGNPAGAVGLLSRGADRVERYAGGEPYRVDVPGLVRWARALVVRIEQRGLADLAATDLVPRLQR